MPALLTTTLSRLKIEAILESLVRDVAADG